MAYRRYGVVPDKPPDRFPLLAGVVLCTAQGPVSLSFSTTSTSGFFLLLQESSVQRTGAVASRTLRRRASRSMLDQGFLTVFIVASGVAFIIWGPRMDDR